MIKNIWLKFKEDKNLQFEIIALILISIFSIAIAPKSLQNDTFYTIRIGEHIQNNGIDGKDPFSWHENLDYTYPHWMYDYIMYGIFQLGGFEAIYISTCALSAILGICIYKVNNKLAKNKIFSFILTIGAMYLLKGYIAARAQLVTFILFILEIYCIEKFLKSKKCKYGARISRDIFTNCKLTCSDMAIFLCYFFTIYRRIFCNNIGRHNYI